MYTNILEYLESTAARLPDKLAYSTGEGGLTFSQVLGRAKAIGTRLLAEGLDREPVVVFMERTPEAISAFFGAVYAGCCYVPLDSEMPAHRIHLILENLKPRAMLCDAVTAPLARELPGVPPLYDYDSLLDTPVEEEALAAIRATALDIDPLYIVFTSGSTGVPKGVAACHRSVIDYMENLTALLRVDEQTVFGMQSPLYFDACLKELYSAIWRGATVYFVPKALFMQPVALVEYLNEQRVNTVCWVVSALTLISGLGTFKEVLPSHLHTIAFGSEVFPPKQFARWRAAVPGARFINLYGPTECTGMSCYYEVDRDFAEGEVIPIGQPFRNTQILLLDQQDKPALPGEPGEICIRGTAVTLGYYNDFDRSSSVFVQNPLNPHYTELIYRTGDLGRYNERGELVFLSRKDYQIKHMGHRIELGEIELMVCAKEDVSAACCIFDEEKQKILLFYVGQTPPAGMLPYLREKLPIYMLPSRAVQLERLPYTPNGKIDRKTLKEQYLKR